MLKNLHALIDLKVGECKIDLTLGYQKAVLRLLECFSY